MPLVSVCSELIHAMTRTNRAFLPFVRPVEAAENALRDATSAFYDQWKRQPIGDVEEAEYAEGESKLRQLERTLHRLQGVVVIPDDSGEDENSENDDDDDEAADSSHGTSNKELVAAKRELEEVSQHHHSRFQAQAYEYSDRLCYARGQVQIRNLQRKVRRLKGKVVSEDESSDCSVEHSDDEADDDAAAVAAEVDIYVGQDSGTKRCAKEELDGELYSVKRQCV